MANPTTYSAAKQFISIGKETDRTLGHGSFGKVLENAKAVGQIWAAYQSESKVKWKTGFFTTSGKILKSPFGWAQHGRSGAWVHTELGRAEPAAAKSFRLSGRRGLFHFGRRQQPAGETEPRGERREFLEHRPFVDHSKANCKSDITYKGALQGDRKSTRLNSSHT